MQPDFQSFPKIHRLSRTVIVTEKLDGTNAQIHITPDNLIYAGSRNRWLTLQNDNFGFANWVHTNRGELLKLGPGTHYGEWWGAGIGRGYGLKNKRFTLFNTQQWSDGLPTQLVTLVPTLYTGPFDTEAIDRVLYSLRDNGSVAAPGYMNPEGIVVFHTHSNTLFKKTLDKNDEHKG